MTRPTIALPPPEQARPGQTLLARWRAEQWARKVRSFLRASPVRDAYQQGFHSGLRG